MASADAQRRAYRRRVAAVRAAVLARLAALYREELDEQDIIASVGRWAERADPVLSGGQATIAGLAEAYLVSLAARAGVSLSFSDLTAAVAGTTAQGNSIADAMGAIGPMILQQIGAGRSLEEAVQFGGYAIDRLGDRELTSVEDRIQDDPSVRSVLSGWTCTVSPDACDGCLENEGEHELTWRPYRHGSCACEVEPLFAPAA